MDLDQAADTLYALPPAEFVASRDDLVKQARADGDRELASQVKQLRKPGAAAALVNLTVRRRGPELDDLLALGAELREAQAALDAPRLKELDRTRRSLLASAMETVREVAEEVGTSVSAATADAVGETLRAALADPDAETAVRSGVLVEPLSWAGFGPVDLDGAVAITLPRRRATEPSEPPDHDRAAAHEALDTAAVRLRDAEDELEGAHLAEAAAQQDVDTLRTTQAELEQDRDRLQRRIDEIGADLAEAGERLDGTIAERESLDEAAARARGAHAQAQDDLDRLEGRRST